MNSLPVNRDPLGPLVIAAIACSSSVGAVEDVPLLEPIAVEGELAPVGLRLDTQSSLGSRLGLSVEELPGQADVIDQDRMQQRGNRDTTEAVTGSVGFSDANTLGNLSGLSARGFDEVQILYDGMRLGTPGMTSRPQGTWIYERVETLSGPGAILHGGGNIVGAVNFVPRRPDPQETTTDVLLSAGSFDSARVAAGHGGPTAIDGLSFRVDGERQTSDGYVDNAELTRDAVSGSLRYDATDRLSLSANLVYLDDELPPYAGVPIDPEQGEPPSRLRRRNPNARDALVEGDEVRFTFDSDYRATPEVRLRNRFQYYEGYREWANFESFLLEDNTVQQKDVFSLDHDQTFITNRSDALIDQRLFGWGARTVLGLQWTQNDFETGRDYQSQNGSVDVGELDNPSAVGSVADFEINRAGGLRSSQRRNIAFFAENQLELGGGFTLLSGVRGERIWIELDNVGGSGDETFTTAEGRLGFVWQATPRVSTFGQVSTGSKFDATTELLTVENLDDDLQQSTGLEAGLRGRAQDGTWQWQVTWFEIEKRNRSVSAPGDPDSTRQVGRQTAEGIELSGYVEPFNRLALEANASVLSAQFRDDAEFGGNTPASVPRQVGNLWAAWTVTDRALARAHVRHVGAREATNANDFQMPSYTLLNLSGSYDFDQDWTVTARARNVTDEVYYPESYGFAERPNFMVGDGRSFEIELSASF